MPSTNPTPTEDKSPRKSADMGETLQHNKGHTTIP